MLFEKREVHLSKTILIKDAFSEEAVTNGMQIWTSYGGKPILKPGGYCLFLNVGQAEFEVEIRSPVYRCRKVSLKADAGEQAEEIFLYPSKSYPVKAGSTWVCGQAPAGTALWFHLEEKENECRLLRDFSRGGDRICIFQKGKPKTGKQNWYIWEKERRAGEYFQAQEIPGEPETYVLAQPLGADYRKKDAVLYPAFTYITDETGEIYLLMDSLKEHEYILHYSYGKEGNMESRTVPIQGRRQNSIVFFQEH